MADPQISVVVPIHDVEPYLRDCLESIATQSFADLEVICVDDGSRDASGEIADAFAAGDRRFRVVHQDNAGLGAARNAGAAQARGTYLGFVDSDDLLPTDAYALLHASLEDSGSDFAVGDVRRLTSLGLRASPTFSPIYSPARRATHVTRDHSLLRDRIAPNKLYRRSFWEGHGFAFPTGVLYEDIPVTIPAHVLARSVDVIDRPVYVWRIRAGADRSITQRRLEERAVRDRVAAVTSVSRFLAEGGWDAEKRAYDHLALTDDLRLFARLLDRADAAVVTVFLDEARTFLAQAHPRALDDATALERLRWELIRAGTPDEVRELAGFARTEAHLRPAVRRWGHVEGDLPFRRGRRPRLPPALFRYDRELTLETRTTGYRVDDQRIVIDGWAHLAHVAVPRPRRRRVRMWLRHDATGERIALHVEPRVCPRATAEGRPPLYDLQGAGFRASVATAELTGRWTAGVDRWHVEVEVRGARTVRRGPLGGPDPGRARRPPAIDVGRLRVGPRIDGDVVSVVVAARPVVVEQAHVEDGGLRLELSSRRELTHLRLRRAGTADLELPLTDRGGGRFDLEVAAAVLAEHATAPAGFTVHAMDAGGRAARLSASEDLDQHAVACGPHEVAVDITRYGYVGFAVRLPAVWLTDVRVAGQGPDRKAGPASATPPVPGFRLRCRFAGARDADLRLELSPRDRIDPRPLPLTVHDDGRVEVVVPVVSRPVNEPAAARGDEPVAPPAPLAAGTWRLQASIAAADGSRREVDVRVPRSLIGALPVTLDAADKAYVFDDRAWQQPAVLVDDDLRDEERGPYNQRRSGAAARSAAPSRPDDAVVFLAGAGGSVGGCPRAVYDELRRRDPDVPVRWAVADRRVVAPPGTTALRLGGREWHEALARSAAVVSDTPLPGTFVRAGAQQCVRLWTGVPIRPVGDDAPGVVGLERSEDARQWSHLVSPGPAATAVLQRAFAFAGEILTVGLPRHDVLSDPGARDVLARDVRDRLGIPPGAPLVLHLPTWVDAERHPGGALRAARDLELPALRAAAGDQAWVVARAHPAVVDVAVPTGGEPRILDVSRFPSVVALLLAADVVVAHPSSVVLEAHRCATPVVVFAPGGAGLTDQLGPPYRDLTAADAPWPTARTTGELHDAVRRLLTAASVPTAPTGTPEPPPEPEVTTVPRGAAASVHGEVTAGRAAAAVVDLLLGQRPRPGGGRHVRG